MNLLEVALLTAVLVALCGAVHFEALRLCNDRLPGLGVPTRARTLLAIEMRLLAGIEALVGLLMISWSASFTFLEMHRDWRVPQP
jgi:hypothetical protein